MGENSRIVRVTRDEFELEDGSVHAIVPPLYKEMTPDEFQKHYDYAVAVERRLKEARGNNQDPPVNGPGRTPSVR